MAFIGTPFDGQMGMPPGAPTPFKPTPGAILPGSGKKEISSSVYGSDNFSKNKALENYVDSSGDLSSAYDKYLAEGGTESKAQWGAKHYQEYGKTEYRPGGEGAERATNTGMEAAAFDAQLKQNLVALQGNINKDIRDMELQSAKYMQNLDLQSKEKLGKMSAMTGMLGGIWGF